jgi:hypothetical protein
MMKLRNMRNKSKVGLAQGLVAENRKKVRVLKQIDVKHLGDGRQPRLGLGNFVAKNSSDKGQKQSRRFHKIGRIPTNRLSENGPLLRANPFWMWQFISLYG